MACYPGGCLLVTDGDLGNCVPGLVSPGQCTATLPVTRIVHGGGGRVTTMIMLRWCLSQSHLPGFNCLMITNCTDIHWWIFWHFLAFLGGNSEMSQNQAIKLSLGKAWTICTKALFQPDFTFIYAGIELIFIHPFTSNGKIYTRGDIINTYCTPFYCQSAHNQHFRFCLTAKPLTKSIIES